MSRPPTPTITSVRHLLGLGTLALSTVALAEPVVFHTTFQTDTLHAETPAITPTGTNWYVMSSKDGSLSGTAGQLYLYATPSSSAVTEGVALFTETPIALTEIGDSITATFTVYPTNVLNLAFGFYNSGGVTPHTTLITNGIGGGTTAVTGGTQNWVGYRASVLKDSTAGNIAVRPAQVSAATNQAQDVIASGTTNFNAPGPISISGSIETSPGSITWPTGFFTNEYRVTYKITRSAADAFTISYSVRDSSDTLLFSSSGTTTNSGTTPASVTSAFDAFAVGHRNVDLDPDTESNIAVTELRITASTGSIARFTQQPLDQTLVPGTAATISAPATGTAPVTYQWFKDDAEIVGVTTDTYEIASVSAADAGTYYVVATNAQGFDVSEPFTVTVTDATAPSFTLHPSTQSVDAGSTLTLSALATGAPTPTYQWFLNNNPITGATFPTYTVASATLEDAGTYHVTATNSSGPVATSNSAIVTVVTAPPAIVTQPTPVTVDVGQTITLNVEASGLPPPSYQWYKGEEPIVGATTATLSISNATTADAGDYHVVVSNTTDAPNSVTSDTVAVTVNVVPPTVTTSPTSLTVIAGQTATFTATYDGSLPRTYQWFKNNTAIEGATGASYSIAEAAPSDTGSYHVVVTNSAGSATSDPATLSVAVSVETPVFATDFSGNVILLPDPETSPAPVAITPSTTNWYVMASKVATNSNVGDDPATADVVEARPLTVAINAPTTSGLYQAAAVFTETPVSLAEVGSYLRVTAVIAPRNTQFLNFGLFNSGGSLPHTTHISGAAAETLLGGTTDIEGGTQLWLGYRGQINHGNAGSPVDIRQRPAQTVSPSTNRTQDLISSGSSAAYGVPGGSTVGSLSHDGSVTFVDDAPYTLIYTIARTGADQYAISIQVYEGTDTSETGTRLVNSSAVTTNSNTLPSVVTSAFDSVAFGARTTSNVAIPQVVVSSLQIDHGTPAAAQAPVITSQPTGTEVAVGGSFTLSVTATGVPAPSYQWFKGGVAIEGATSASYMVASATETDAGSYTVTVTNLVDSVTSDAAVVTVTGGGDAYTTWATGFGLNPATDGAPSANPSGDGISNALKFVLGGDPTVSDTSILPVLTQGAGSVTFAFEMETAAAGLFTVTTEYSTDLATWTTAQDGVGGVTIVTTAVDADTNLVTVTIPAGTRLFVRLTATN